MMSRLSVAGGLSRREVIRLLGMGAGVSAVSSLAEVAGLSRAAAQTASRTKLLTGVPAGAIIRTVLRDVAPDTITGATLFHEHLSTANWRLPLPRPTNFREDVDLISDEVRAAREEGIGCIVDCSHQEMGCSLVWKD